MKATKLLLALVLSFSVVSMTFGYAQLTSLMHVNVASNAAPLLSRFGNSGFKSGANSLDTSALSPLFSAIFISPDHRQITPASVISSWIASAALSTNAFDRFSVFPRKTEQIIPAVTRKLQT